MYQGQENIDAGHFLARCDLHRNRVGHLLSFREERDRVAELGQGIAIRVGALQRFSAGRLGRRLIQSRDVIRARFQAVQPVLAAIVGACACRCGVAVTSAIVKGAIELNGCVDGRLGVVEFHLAAEDSRRRQGKHKRVDGLARLNGEDRWHLVGADAAGRKREIAIALDRDGVTPGRYLGKRESAAIIGGLKD